MYMAGLITEREFGKRGRVCILAQPAGGGVFFGEVGDAGGEGLVPALSRGDPQDSSHDEDIGENNEE